MRPAAEDRGACTGRTAAEPDGATLRRFMTATDFLERRADQVERRARRVGLARRGPLDWSGGSIAAEDGPAELDHARHAPHHPARLRRPAHHRLPQPQGRRREDDERAGGGPHLRHRPRRRRGGLGQQRDPRNARHPRAPRSSHRNTTRELLEDLERFTDVYQARIGDLGAFVRSQGDAHFDVLASDERPDVTGMIRAQDFTAVHELLQRFYRVILVDTGNNMRAENWLAAADAADLLVVTTTVREDTGYSGLWMLDALQESGVRQPQVPDRHGALRPVLPRRPAARPATSPRSTSSAPSRSTAFPTTRCWWRARWCPTASSPPRPTPRG